MKPYLFLFLSILFRTAITSNRNIETIKSWLSGRFNNVKQAAVDFSKNRTDGHESIYVIFNRHASEEDFMVASYYLKNVSKPYRYRYYKFIPPANNDGDSLSSQYCCIMKIYKPSKAADEKLKVTAYSTTESLPPIEEFELITGIPNRTVVSIILPAPGYCYIATYASFCSSHEMQIIFLRARICCKRL